MFHDLDQRLSLFAEYAPLHFGITDPDNGGTFLKWNQISEEMFGYTPDEVIGKLKAIDLHADQSEFNSVLVAVDQGGFDGECTFRRKDGSVFLGRLIVKPVVAENGHIIERCGFIQDLSESKRIQAELEARRQQQYHEDRIYQMGRLAGVIAHDINNVLSSILCTAQLVSMDLEDHHLAQHDLKTIEQAVDSASELMRKLLVFTGRQVTEPQSVHLKSWLKQHSLFFRRLLRRSTSFELQSQSTGILHIDPNDLQQILINLLVNGDKSMPDGGTLILRSRDVKDRVEIEVEDQGIGMSLELQQKIFEPFFTTRAEGTGLGLSTVKDITEKAQGILSLDSTVGVGTCVKLSFPRVIEQIEMEKSQSHSHPSSFHRLGQVLLVDDQDEVRVPIARALRKMGFQVQEASSKSETLERLSYLERLDLFMTDSKLSDGDGKDLLPTVLKHFPNVTSILFSGYLSSFNEESTHLFDARLSKPLSLTTLRSKLIQLLPKASS